MDQLFATGLVIISRLIDRDLMYLRSSRLLEDSTYLRTYLLLARHVAKPCIDDSIDDRCSLAKTSPSSPS